MPQASAKTIEAATIALKAVRYSDVEPSDITCLHYLKDHGFTPSLRIPFHWVKPTEEYEPTANDYACINYLIQEWDYGGIVQRGNVNKRS